MPLASVFVGARTLVTQVKTEADWRRWRRSAVDHLLAPTVGSARPITDASGLRTAWLDLASYATPPQAFAYGGVSLFEASGLSALARPRLGLLSLRLLRRGLFCLLCFLSHG